MSLDEAVDGSLAGEIRYSVALFDASTMERMARHMAAILTAVAADADQGVWDLPLLADLSLVMRDSSICGLGQAAPNPVDCVVKYFPHELSAGSEP